MKAVSVAILLFCLFIATFSQWILIGVFKINQNNIAATVCINRSHPEMHCNGQCFLNKQLNNQEKQNSNATNTKEKTSIQLFAEKLIDNVALSQPVQAGNYSFYIFSIPQEHILSFFQPPQA